VFGPIVCIVYKEVVEEVLEILGTLNTEVETAVVYGVGTEICDAAAFTKGFVVFHVCIIIAAWGYVYRLDGFFCGLVKVFHRPKCLPHKDLERGHGKYRVDGTPRCGYATHRYQSYIIKGLLFYFKGTPKNKKNLKYYKNMVYIILKDF